MQPKLFKLEAFFERFEHKDQMIVLGASDVEPYKVDDLLKLPGEKLNLKSISLKYDEVGGNKALRQAIAKSYKKRGFSFKNILVTNGASEAILLAMHAALGPGHTALVCHPAYQGLPEMAKTAGANVIRYNYHEDAQLEPDLDFVREQLDQLRPKVLLLNSPHNPTGKVLRRSDLKDLFTRAQRSGTRVIVDEVFHGIWIEHAAVPSAIKLSSEAVVIGCLSKVYGLPGLRIGWLAGPEDFITKCKELRYYTSLAAPSLVQQLGEIAMRHKDELIDRGQKNVTRNYKYAVKWLKKHSQFFDYVPPTGGTVMLLKLKRKVNTKTFAETLAHNYKVFLVPCTWTFDMKQRYLRLGLGLNPALFAKGLRKLHSYLANGVFEQKAKRKN